MINVKRNRLCGLWEIYFFRFLDNKTWHAIMIITSKLGKLGGINVDKKDILNKSRNSSTDEGLEYFENKGLRIGYTTFYFVAIFMIIFNKYIGKESDSIFTLLWIFFAVDSISKFKFTHKKFYLFGSIISLILMVYSFVNFILGSLG